MGQNGDIGFATSGEGRDEDALNEIKSQLRVRVFIIRIQWYRNVLAPIAHSSCMRAGGSSAIQLC